VDFSAHREAVASQLVVGRSCTTGDAGLHAFLRDGTDDADLGTFGGTERVATGVNDSGYVVGTAQSTGDGSFRAFVYDVVIKHQIGTFGGVNSAAYGINAAGILVGDANNTSFDREAFLYDGNTLYNLNAFIVLPRPMRETISRNSLKVDSWNAAVFLPPLRARSAPRK